MIAIYICKGNMSGVKLRAFGVSIDKSGPQMSYAKEIVVTLAGAAVNIAAAGILYAATFPTMRSMLLVAANLAAAAFSLLPVGNLDGGAVVRLVAERFGGVEVAYRASKICSFLVLAPLFAAGFWLLIGPERNFTLLVVCVYLVGVVCSGEY
jgi:membrane-associated protease RseP (regulator of RpoE activity)